MGVPDGLVAGMFAPFVALLYITIQQFFIEDTNNKVWVFYRIFILITVFNEVIILIVLISTDVADGGVAVFLRSLVWFNNFVGSYLIYEIVKLAFGWVYKQVPGQEIPKWFSYMLAAFLGSNAVILFICVIIAIIQGNDAAIAVHGVYLDFFIMILNLFGMILPLKVGMQLGNIVKNRRVAESRTSSTGLESKNSSDREKSRNLSQTRSATNTDGSRKKGLKSLKKLLRARRRMYIGAAVLLITFIGSLVLSLGSIGSIGEDINKPDALDSEVYPDVSSFFSHFFFGLFYELLIIIPVYQSTKCCMDHELKDTSLWIKFGLTGNTDANCHHTKFPFFFWYNFKHHKNELDEELAKQHKDDKTTTDEIDHPSTNVGESFVGLESVLINVDEMDDEIRRKPRYESSKHTNRVQLTDQIGSILREPTPTQGHHIVDEIEMPDIEVHDLNKIDREGRKIGKRKKKKAQKTAKEMKQIARENKKHMRGIKEEREKTRYAGLAKKEETYAPDKAVSKIEASRGGIDAPLPTDMPDTATAKEHKKINSEDQLINDIFTASQEADSDDDNDWPTTVNPEIPIKLIIYEFENVLATNLKHITGQTAKDIAAIDLNKMLLAFGMVDRLEMLHEQFSEVIMNGNENRMCFAITAEQSQTVFKVFERVDFAQYFVSLNANPRGAGKKLSHVIGRDHKLWEDSEGGKKHLLVLRLMKFLKCNHENVLYVGHDKEVIQHLTNNNFCQTFYVKTEGLTFHDLARIENIFFPKERSDNEKDTSDYHKIARKEDKEKKAKKNNGVD